MIYQLKLHLSSEKEVTPNWFWAYNLYGSLMQKIDPDYAEDLHKMGLSPISQYLETSPTNKELLWTVNMVGDSSVYISDILKNVKEYYLENHKTTLNVIGFDEIANINEINFANNYLGSNQSSRRLTISTITPCSFKSDNKYVIFPTTELIIKSAVQKWNAFSNEVEINDDEAISQIIDAIMITSYKLRSFQYHIKGVKIPSFYGEFTISIKGSEPIVRLINMLLYYLQYSGLGIKCALGMGGIKITDCAMQSRENKFKGV